MAASLRIKIDTRDLERKARALGELGARQAPFAIAATLTELAKGASVRVQRQLPKSFKVRNRGLKRAITYEGARKNDNPPTSYVGVRQWAAFLRLQALGGTKRGKRGHRIAVPTRLVKRTRSGRVRKADRPRTLRQHKALREDELDKGRIRVVRRSAKRSIFFTLTSSVKIKARWPFRDQVEDHVRRHVGHTFDRRFAAALRTARNR